VLFPRHFLYEGMVMNDKESWAMEEFGGAQVGDERLNKRLIKLAGRLLAGRKRPAQENAYPARSHPPHRYARGIPGSKRGGEPGIKTFWLGFDRVSSFVKGIEKMRKIMLHELRGMGWVRVPPVPWLHRFPKLGAFRCMK
jgi:hypothetical protein